MPKRKLNLTGKSDHNKDDRIKVYHGSTQDLLEARIKQLPKFLKEIEEQFEGYSGGGAALIMNTYDENNHCNGANITVIGCDDMEGIVKLAKHINKACDSLVESTVQNVKEQGGVEGMMALLQTLTELGLNELGEEDE